MIPITIALPKGKLLEPSIKLFDALGLVPEEVKDAGRRLIFESGRHALTYLVVRATTKIPRITEKFFGSRGVPADIIKLYGSIELAPLVGLSHVIVDLISTGRTLKENNLELIEIVTESTARLIT